MGTAWEPIPAVDAAPIREGKQRLRVCSFESRRSREMQSLIERHGGLATVAPSMREVPNEESRPAFAFAESLLAGRIDVVVFFTGVGTRGLLELLASRYSPDELLAALARCTVVARGPKPVAVLNEWQIRIDHRAPQPHTWKELLTLFDAHIPASGRAVAVQEYGQPNPAFYDELSKRGARLQPVPVYRWALPEDVGPLDAAIRDTIAGRFDLLMFTSAHQLANVLQLAGQRQIEPEWLQAARRCVIASIGPTTSEALEAAGLTVDVEADPPKMGPLVRAALSHGPRLLAGNSRVASGEPPDSAADPQ